MPASTAPYQRNNNSNQFRYGISFLIIAVSFLALVSYQIYVSFQTAKTSARMNVNNLSLVLESKLNTDFDAAERIVTILAEDTAPDAMQMSSQAKYKNQMTRWLQAHLIETSTASALRIFDANGERLYTSAENEGALNIADRNFFQTLKNQTTKKIVFSDVAVGKITKRTTMYVGKAIRDSNANFLGAALIAIDLTNLQNELKKIELGENGAILLRRIDNGAMVVRYPGLLNIDNKPYLDSPLRQNILKSSANGTTEVAATVDGIYRIYGYRAIGHFPLFVAVGISDTEYLAEWRKNSVLSLFASLLFLVILVVSYRKLIRADKERNLGIQELRESESRLRNLINDNHSVILQIEPESGKILDANLAACEFYGWSHTQMCSKYIQEINQMSSANVSIERVAALQKKCNAFIFQHRLANGDVRTVEVHATPIISNGKSLLVSIIHDITEAKKSEAALMNTARLLKEAQSIAQIGSWEINLRTGDTIWSDEMFHIYEMPENSSAPTFASYLATIHQEDRSNITTSLRESFTQGRIELTHRIELPDGAIKHVRILGETSFAEDGTPLRSAGTAQDVTRAVLQEQALRESEQRFRTIADYTYDWEYWQDSDDTLLYVSPACERVSGYSQAELYADPDLLRRIVHPEDAHIYTEHSHNLAMTGNTNITFRILRKDQEVRWIAHGCCPVFDKNGNPLGRRASNRDITDLKNAEQLAQQLAYFDSLTNLPNRRMLMNRLHHGLAQAKRFKRMLAVMFIDLDRFKYINDTYGHQIGDVLLIEVANRLETCIRASDTVSRAGGDEFIVILPEIENTKSATVVAEKIIQVLKDPIIIADIKISITASIGIAIHKISDNGSAEDLMKKADSAMYRIKNGGRNGYQLQQNHAEEIS